MSNVEHGGIGQRVPDDDSDDVRVRASSSSARRSSGAGQPQSAVTTAELPVVRPPRAAGSAQLRYAHQPARRPTTWRARPDAAPAPIRLVVWTLSFVFILFLVGYLALLVHPTWLSFLRNTVTTPRALGVLGAATVLL